MDIDFERRGSVTVAVVRGQVDASSAPELTEQLTTTIEAGGRQLVADLSELEYSSSAGLRAFLTAVKLARSTGGDFRIAAVHTRVERVLTMSGFSSIMQMFDSVEAAVESFGS